jgi:hypothetical protein
MSHHLDTPLAASSGQLFIDDLYVFAGAASTVLVLTVNSDVSGQHAEPGFHPGARYEFKVHFDGAACEELAYRVSFGPPDDTGRQAVELRSLTGLQAGEDAASGELVITGLTGQPATANGTRLWAGRASDSFYLDQSLLAIVSEAVATGTAPDLASWHPEDAQNSFTGTTVQAIALEVQYSHPQLRPGARAGVWCATKLATDSGGWRQVNRAGHPMMWPIFWPDDTQFSNPANSRHPSRDAAADAGHLASLVAAVTAAAGTAADPQGYGETVARQLLPDVLPYVIGTPATFGFTVRNGRPLADNAPEVMLSLVTGTAVPSGLTPAVTRHLRASRFPYVIPAEQTSNKSLI